MKKFSKILAATLGVLLIAGCNGNGNSTKGSSSTSSPKVEPSTSTPAPSVSTPTPSTPTPSTPAPSVSTPTEKPAVTGYGLYVNGDKVVDFVINEEASLQPGQEAEYMASATLAVNDVLTVLDSNNDEAMNWENLDAPGAYTALAEGEHTVYLKVWEDGTSAWLAAPEVGPDTPEIPEDIVVTSFGLYADDVLVAAFEVNAGNTAEYLNAEYMTSANLAAGVSLTIKDVDGNLVEGVWWENTSSNSYVTTAEGTYTLYYKDYKDGGKTVWVEAPAGGELPDIGDIEVQSYGLYVNGELRADLAFNAGATGGAKEEYFATVDLVEGDVVTIKDKDEVEISGVYFENAKSTGSFTATASGSHTFYFKLNQDNSYTVWDVAPAGSSTPVDPSQSMRVYFSNPKGWSTVYVYTWNGCDMGGWPGTVMEYDAATGYWYMDNIVAGCNIIFGNGESGGGSDRQTDDLTVPTDGSNLCDGTNWTTYAG